MPNGPRPDAAYAHPDAFRLARRAFHGEDTGRLLERLERHGLTCPRLLLSACIHHFLALPRAEQAVILVDYLSATGDSASAVPDNGSGAMVRPSQSAAPK